MKLIRAIMEKLILAFAQPIRLRIFFIYIIPIYSRVAVLVARFLFGNIRSGSGQPIPYKILLSLFVPSTKRLVVVLVVVFHRMAGSRLSFQHDPKSCWFLLSPWDFGQGERTSMARKIVDFPIYSDASDKIGVQEWSPKRNQEIIKNNRLAVTTQRVLPYLTMATHWCHF